MSIEDQPVEKVPRSAQAIVAEFGRREQADAAVEELKRVGLGSDRISLVARGAGVSEGRFRPGAMMLTVHSDGPMDAVERILRSAGAQRLRSGVISATGEVLEVGEAEEEEAAR